MCRADLERLGVAQRRKPAAAALSGAIRFVFGPNLDYRLYLMLHLSVRAHDSANSCKGAAHMKAARKGYARKMQNPIFRFFVFSCALILSALILGLIFFTLTVANMKQPETIGQADGIVVWTGKGGNRVKSGVALLAKKKGERLLISGTNPDLSRDTILASFEVSAPIAECCIDMDQATNTIENARQTANWARALDYDHIILVTSAYHMPRAEIEIRSAAGRLAITPYPVQSNEAKIWWRSSRQLKRLLGEYGKLLLSFIRNNHQRGTPPAKPQAPTQ